jgi:hypothetical protein
MPAFAAPRALLAPRRAAPPARCATRASAATRGGRPRGKVGVGQQVAAAAATAATAAAAVAAEETGHVRSKTHVCGVCARYADLLLRDVPYSDLPINLRMKVHFERYKGSSWAIIVVADMLADLSVANILRGVQSPYDAAGVAAGFCSAYALADLASGLANWFTFTFLSNGERACYCDGTRDFARRMATNCAFVLPFLSLLLAHAPQDLMLYSFLVYFLSFVSVIPALVDWSGSTSFPPSAARLLRRLGALAKPSTTTPTQFLNNAWHAILAEGRIFTVLEKWIYLGSRGTLIPKEWRRDPTARARAFASDLHLLDRFVDGKTRHCASSESESEEPQAHSRERARAAVRVKVEDAEVGDDQY